MIRIFPKLKGRDVFNYTYPFTLHYESSIPPGKMSPEQRLELNNQVHMFCVKSEIGLAR